MFDGPGDRASDNNSYFPDFSPLPLQASPGFSRLDASLTNSPFVSKARGHQVNPFVTAPQIPLNSVRDIREPRRLTDIGPTLPQLPAQPNLPAPIDKNQQFTRFGSLFSKLRDGRRFDNPPLINTGSSLSPSGTFHRGFSGVDNETPSGYKCDQQSESGDSNDLQDSDEDNPDKRKLNKGLKMLSIVVRDIVIEKQTTTYKEVADIILRDTIRDEQLSSYNKTEILKEEQNIKRRVYDALNVLISAGVLIKDGKKVRKNDNLSKIKINLKRSEISSMQTKIVG